MQGNISKVVLVGPRAAGKTTLGRALAAELSWEFVDSDDLLAVQVGQPAEDYLRLSGEQAFRKVEEEIARAAIARDGPRVVALGGGAVLQRPVRNDLEDEQLLVVFVRAPVPTLVERQMAVPRAPLTREPLTREPLTREPREALQQEVTVLLVQRWRYYVEVCDMQLDTSSANVDACLRSIMDKMGHLS